MPILQHNDIELYYEQAGHGPDLVLIGGLTSDHHAWKSLLRYLTPHFRVLIFDNRGAGESSTPDYPYSLEMMAEDTLAVMNACHIDHAHILGHSLGGAIAMQVAISTPERVNKLIVACSRAKISAVSRLFFQTREKIQALGVSSELLAEYVMPFLFSETFLANKMNVKGFAQWASRNPHQQSAIGFSHQLHASQSKDFTDELHKITAETLIIGGAEDIIATPKQTKALSDLIPKSQLTLMEACAHMPHVEQVKQFAENILSFLC